MTERRPHLTSLISRAARRACRALQELPFDAACLAREAPVPDRIRRFINEHRRRRVSVYGAPILIPLARLAWLVWCPIETTLFVRRHRMPLFGSEWRRGVMEGWLYGRHLYTRLPLDDAAVMQVGHLELRHWVLLWSALGEPADRLLARDKLQLGTRLAALEVAVPELLGQLERGACVEVAALPWARAPILFIKPRNGARAVGACTAERLSPTHYRINGEEIVTAEVLAAHLNKYARDDALLVQSFLQPAADTLSLSPQAPIELRLTTARRPGGESFVVGCVMKVQRPGAHTSTILDGALAVLVNPHSGEMHTGILLHELHRRYAAVPWNGAPLEGRKVPRYSEAANMVIRASEALPGLPVIGWDVLITATGPVVLEANISLSWWHIHLWHAATDTPSPLLPIIMEWIDTHESARTSAAKDPAHAALSENSETMRAPEPIDMRSRR